MALTRAINSAKSCGCSTRYCEILILSPSTAPWLKYFALLQPCIAWIRNVIKWDADKIKPAHCYGFTTDQTLNGAFGSSPVTMIDLVDFSSVMGQHFGLRNDLNAT